MRKCFSVVLVTVTFLLLFPFGKASTEPMAIIADMGHPVLFGVLAFVGGVAFVGSGKSRQLMLARYLAVWVAAVAFGGLTELVQSLVGRGTSLRDFLNNGIGAAAGLLVVAAHRTVGSYLRVSLRLLAMGLFILAVLSPLNDLVSIWRQHLELPDVASFERFDAGRWVFHRAAAKPTTAFATNGNQSLAIVTDPGSFAGVILKCVNADWSCYEALEMDILRSEPPDMEVLVSVVDVEHEREEMRLELPVQITLGVNKVRVPLRRFKEESPHPRLDLSRVFWLGIFVRGQESKRTFYVDNIRLTTQRQPDQ